MMISVVIPLYNKENCVARTIESVLNQTYNSFEIVVVNDGSTDNSLKVVSSIKDERIKIFSKKNEGVSIARNFGIQQSKGEYICFLDADDEWNPNFLESMCEAIKMFPEYGFFSCPIETRKNGENKNYGINNNSEELFVIEDYCKTFLKNRKAICCVGSVCVQRRLLIDAGMFPPHVKRGEDHDLWLRLACNNKVVYTTKTKMIYNLDSENNSRSNYNSYRESFPYWKWYEYPYFPKNSLFLFTTYFLLSHTLSALKHGKVSSAWAMFSNIRII